MKIPAWLNRESDNMSDEQFDPPPIAMIPPPDVEPQQRSEPDAEVVAFANANVLVERYRQKLTNAEAVAAESMLQAESWKRRAVAFELEVAELRNNLQTTQSQIEDLRQKEAELSAFFGNIRPLIAHLLARFDDFEIPLVIRRRMKRNGKTQEVNHVSPPQSIDRPAIRTDQAEG